MIDVFEIKNDNKMIIINNNIKIRRRYDDDNEWIYGGSSNALSFQDLDEAAEDSSRRRRKNKLSFDERKWVDLDIVSISS